VVVVDLTRTAAHVVPLRSMLAYLRAYLQCQPGERTRKAEMRSCTRQDWPAWPFA
jgi:hypothetical protein